MTKKNKFYLIVTVVALVFALSIRMGTLDKTASSVDKEATGEASIGGSFSLVNHKGEAVTEKTFIGKPQVVFFGFTHCPSICPTEMATITEALHELSSDASKVTPIFITVDPERDTPEVMTAFLKNFHPNFIGLTGSREQIDAMIKTYKVYSSKVVNQQNPADYMMDHSGFIYLMDSNGKYVSHFSAGGVPSYLADGIKKSLLNQ